MTHKPSALAKQLIEDLCECDPPLQCCAGKTVSAMWRDRLPQVVKTAVAGMSLKTDLETVLQKADDAYESLGTAGAATVAAVEEGAQADKDDEVAAISRSNRGRGYNNNRGNNTNRGQSRGRGPGRGQRGSWGANSRTTSNRPQDRHPDGPPENACRHHWRWGRSAYHCAQPESCPWKDQCAPKRETPREY